MANIEPKLPPIMARINKVFSGIRCLCCIAHRLSCLLYTSSLMKVITDLKDILANHSRVLEIIRNELTEVRDKYGDDRRTEISDADFDMQDEDLIPVEDIVITMTTNGYIKRLPIDTYRTQNRLSLIHI